MNKNQNFMLFEILLLEKTSRALRPLDLLIVPSNCGCEIKMLKDDRELMKLMKYYRGKLLKL